MKVAIYARVSTTDQNYEGQLEELNALAERSGWEVVEVYSEKISGTKATEDRPELKRMMHDANRAAIRMGLIEEYTAGKYTYPLSVTITTDQASALGQKQEFNWALQEEFRKLSEASGMAMRTLDFVVVKLGQEPDEVNGFARTICAEQAPLCHVCSVKPMCAYGSKR